MVGVMRWPEQASWFHAAADPSHNLWFVRDRTPSRAPRAGASGALLHELEKPGAAGRPAVSDRSKVNLRDDHLQ